MAIVPSNLAGLAPGHHALVCQALSILGFGLHAVSERRLRLGLSASSAPTTASSHSFPIPITHTPPS